MAGFYPDVPGNRIPYDLDGTAGVYMNNGAVSDFSPAQLANFNRETVPAWGPSPGFGTYGYYVLLFPRKMDITGSFVVYRDYYDGAEWSSNTSNGSDGTWTGFTSGYAATANPSYRTGISTLALTNVRAVRYITHTSSYNGAFGLMHVYGKPTSGENTDRLELWHPTLDQRVGGAYFDWGDAQRTTNASKTFRVKNLSPTLTANGIDITFETLTDTTPTYDSMHTFSDGGAYAGTINISNLAPDAVSGIITIRRDFPANAVLGLWAGRINTTATSWT